MGICKKLGELWGEKCGYEAAESTPAILSPESEEDMRESSHQQVGYKFDGEFGDGFDEGFVNGIRKARRQ